MGASSMLGSSASRGVRCILDRVPFVGASSFMKGLRADSSRGPSAGFLKLSLSEAFAAVRGSERRPS